MLLFVSSSDKAGGATRWALKRKGSHSQPGSSEPAVTPDLRPIGVLVALGQRPEEGTKVGEQAIIANVGAPGTAALSRAQQVFFGGKKVVLR